LRCPCLLLFIYLILPISLHITIQAIQDKLEEIGLLVNNNSRSSVFRSTQSINLNKNLIRNIVSFELNNPTPLFSTDGRTRGTITVDVTGTVDQNDLRRINVKFNSCQFTISNSPGIDVTIPLPGIIGPTGWLRTVYVDDELRITHGHKGSVFILRRTSMKKA
jgi:hypothetical protein